MDNNLDAMDGGGLNIPAESQLPMINLLFDTF